MVKGSPSEWWHHVRSEASLHGGGAGHRQPGGGQGQALVGQAGQAAEGGGSLPFGLLGAVPLFSLFVFHLPSPPWPSRLPLIVCRAIKGQMSGRSLAAVGSPRTDTVAAGGWVAEGGPGRVIGLTTSCTEHSSPGLSACGSEAPPSNPGRKA